jgi:hypothetical protein
VTPRRRAASIRRYALVVALVVSVTVAATLAAASVLYQFTEHEHVHPGVPSGWEASLGLITDSLGLTTVVLVAIQLMWGYHVVRMPMQVYDRRHPALGWAIMGASALHGVTGVWHSLVGQIESAPIWLDFIGLGMVTLLAVQMTTGYGLLRARSSKSRSAHAAIVIAVALVVVAHAFIGVYHTVTG